MKKIVMAAASFASVSLLASAAFAAPLPSSGTATLTFSAQQSIPVDCVVTAAYTGSGSGAVLETIGAYATGPGACPALHFKDKIAVWFDGSGTGTIPGPAAISNIYLDTVYGECKQVGSLPASLDSEWSVSGAGTIAGTLNGPPVTTANCLFDGVIVFN